MPDGEDIVLLERVKAGPSPPPLASEDPSPPQPQPQSDPEPKPEPEPNLEPDPVAIAAEAEKLKEQGNESFKRARYGEAVDLYTKAIGMSLSLSSSSSSSSSLSSFLHLPFHLQSLLRFADPLTRNDHI
jgi:outer membrane biosynthesis protein TonB